MSLQRITRIQVLIAGAVVIVGVAILFLVVLIRPEMKKIADKVWYAEEDEKIAATRPKKEAALAEALAREEGISAQWDEIMEARMPKIDLSDPIAATLRLWDLPGEEQAVMSKWFNSSGAVVAGYGFQTWPTAMPSSFPDRNMRYMPPLSWNLTVQVKDFPALLEWLMKLPEAPRFMVMHNVSIQGSHGPDAPLVASVPVTLYQWTGVEPAAAAAPSGGAGAGAGAGAGGGMGGGRGMRGGGRGGRGGGRGGMRGGRRGRM
jgi:hypothetical protein